MTPLSKLVIIFRKYQTKFHIEQNLMSKKSEEKVWEK